MGPSLLLYEELSSQSSCGLKHDVPDNVHHTLFKGCHPQINVIIIIITFQTSIGRA